MKEDGETFNRTGQIELLLEGKAGMHWYIGADRVQTRAALVDLLAGLPLAQFTGLVEGSLFIQVTAPPCAATFHVARIQTTIQGTGTVEVQTEIVYLCASLEHQSFEEARRAVRGAFTVALERLAGRSDFEALQIAGLDAGGGDTGGSKLPN